MRATLLSIATLAAGLGACTEAAPHSLPLGEVLGTDLLPRSLQVVGEAPYWMEVVPPASGETAPSLRLRRADATSTTTVDAMPGYYIEQGGAFVVVDRDQLAWGTGAALLGCGQGRWLRADAAPTPLRFLADGSACRAVPLALRDGQMLAMTEADPAGTPTTVLTWFALATDARERVGALPNLPIDRPRVDRDEAFVMTTTYARWDEGQLVRFALATPAQPRAVGATIASRGGLAVTEDQIVVVDNGGAGAPARVLGYPRAADAPESPTVIAVLPGPAHDLTIAGDALWMIAGPPRPAGGAVAASTTLWRVDLDGTRVSVEFDARVLELSSTGDALLLVVENPTGLPTLYRTPLPAQ